MAKWRFFIPFYYGKNEHVIKKGGAPVNLKIDYLQKTIASIKSLNVDAEVLIYVCNDISYEKAISVHPKVEKIDCYSLHLPLESVKAFQKWHIKNGDDQDIVGFNEDDQVIAMSDVIKEDILNTNDPVIFTPHRWAKQFFYFRRKKRPVYKLDGVRGLIDNYEKPGEHKRFQYNREYYAQSSRDTAYAACWFMKGKLFNEMSFDVPEDKIELESPSFSVFDSGTPILKLTDQVQQKFSEFIVNHLSGYDYNRRLVKFFK